MLQFTSRPLDPGSRPGKRTDTAEVWVDTLWCAKATLRSEREGNWLLQLFL